MIENGNDQNFNNEKKSKNKLNRTDIIILIIIFLVPIGFGIYSLIPEPTPPSPPPTPVVTYEVKLINNDDNKLTLTNTTAYSNKNFSSDITLNRTLAPTEVMPDSLSASDVLCLDRQITFTYKANPDKHSAHIDIPSSEIKGNITINVPLITPTEPFSITLKANGGKFEDKSVEKSFTVLYGQRLKDLPDYNKPEGFHEGYHFLHWELENNPSQTLDEDDVIPIAPEGAAYVAVCSLNEIALTINPNGGEFPGGGTSPIHLNILYDTVINEVADYPGEPTKNGYTFLHYKDIDNKIYLPTDTVITPKLVFGLEAVYEENLKITLNANGGTFSGGDPEKILENGYKGITLSELEGYEEPTSSTQGEEFAYWSINGSGEYYKNTPLEYSGEITLTANYAECPHTQFDKYTVIDNHLYGICETCKAQIEITNLSSYENKFLLLDNASSIGQIHDISEMANIVNTAADHSILDIYFINGKYELGGSRGAGQKVITVNARGLLNSSGDPTASIDCTRSTEYPYPRYHLFINFIFENLNMVGEDEYKDGFYFGLLASTITYNNCYFKGKQSFYSDKVICNDCEFDSTGMLDQPDYAIYSYSSYNVEFNRCVFNSDGKALKIYAEGAAPDAVFTLNDCNFFNKGKIRTDKAAIEVNSYFQPKNEPYNVYITRCHQQDYASLYHDDDTKANFIVKDCD